MGSGSERSGASTGELLAVLSLGADLGMGHPMEHVVRQTALVLRLAERLGLDEDEREVLAYVSLLAWVGCHVDAYEQAKWFGDEQALKADAHRTDLGGIIAPAAFVLRHVGAGQRLPSRVRTGVAFLGAGRRAADSMLENHWRAAETLAVRLGLSQAVRDGVMQTFERWDGSGEPQGLRGTEISVASRLVNLADVAEVFHRSDGMDAALAVARQRRGTQFDPNLVDELCAAAPELFDDATPGTGWETVSTQVPGLRRPLPPDELDAALEAVAEFVDLKSPYTFGHSRMVADLAAAAARKMELPGAEVRRVRNAALLHDVGRLGVPNTVWDKTDPLTHPEVERVRLHPYLTHRMLSFAPGLASLAGLASQHHERLDGSGYPQGLSGGALSPAARVLAAADFYQGKTEARPHRPAAEPDEAAAMLRAEVRAGRMDGAAAEAVLQAAGHRALGSRRTWPAGLTAREVEVLRLLARGLSNKEIAQQLVIAPKTAARHVEHIYTKTGASNRAMAGVFAVRHGLTTDGGGRPGDES